MYITLMCGKCDNTDCDICPLGTYIPEGSLRGCTRKASSNIESEYEYLREELEYSEAATDKYKSYLLEQQEELYNKIYNCPLGKKLDKNGKVVE